MQYAVFPCLSTRCPQNVPNPQSTLSTAASQPTAGNYIPHLPAQSPDTRLPDLDFAPAASAPLSPSPVAPSCFGAYRFSCCLSRCMCLSLVTLCSQYPCPCSQVQVCQDLEGMNDRAKFNLSLVFYCGVASDDSISLTFDV